MINAISDPAVLLDLKGTIVLANEAFARYVRMDIQTIIGQSSLGFVPPDRVQRRREQLEEIIRSGKPRVIEELRPGQAFVAHMHPVFDEAGGVAGVALVHHDVSQLRLAQETLEMREVLYRNIVESASDGVATLDGTTITYVNPRLLAIGGYAPQEAIGASILQFIHPQEVPKVIGYIAKRRSNPGSNAKYETILKAKNGQDINVEINASSLGASTGGNEILVVIHDITEQKRAEKVQSSILRIAQAAISSDSLEGFYQSVHSTIAELMPAKNFYIAVYDEPSRLIAFPYFVDEFDETPAPKPLGKGLTEYVFRTGEPLLATPEIFIEMEKRGEVESIGAPSIDWLGAPLTIQNRTFGVLVVQSYTEGVRYGELERDILRFVSGQVAMAIQRRQTADEISDREQFLSGVLNSIQDGISILDMDFTIMRVNRTMEQRHAAAMPLVGKKCYKAYHLRDDRCRACPTHRTLETSQAAHEIISREGSAGVEWLDLYSFPFIDQKTGQMKGVIEYVRDITPQKLAEDKLQSSLQEKEVLLREIHHRVKNNLQVIQALLSLQSRQIKNGSAEEMYKESQNRIRSMALVHERLYKSTNLSRIEFAEYIRSLVVHLFHSLLPDTSRIGLKLDLEPVELDINIAIPCGLIVNELVSNALKHAFPEPRPGEVTVSFHKRNGSTLSLGVTDDGQGLPPDFDIHRSETLGMQIIMTLVSQIDGRLEIGRGPGASFLVEFQESGGWTAGERP